MNHDTIVIVGLRNASIEYENTRHNIASKFLSTLSSHCGFNFQNKSKLSSQVASGVFDGFDLILCLPDSYMNLSGTPVQKLLSFYKIKTDKMFVIHDDIDLPLAKVKYKFGGSSGGHNGLKSIDQLVGNLYHRIRIGIGRPENNNIPISDFVLGNFSENEQISINFTFSNLIKNDLAIYLKKAIHYKT